jgi:hypothetical protein
MCYDPLFRLLSYLLCSNATSIAGKKVENKVANTDRKLESSSNQQLELLGDLHKKVDVHGAAVSRLAETMYVIEGQKSIFAIANSAQGLLYSLEPRAAGYHGKNVPKHA